MSNTTSNLKLFKYDTSTDGKEVFSIQTALNDNWDKIDSLGTLPGTVSNLSSTVSGHTTSISSLQTTVKSILTATLSKAGNGYVKFSNGFQICWGTGNISNSNTTITFATAFTTACRVTMTKVHNSDGRTEDWWIKSVTKSNFVARSSESDPIHYVAVGY